MKPYSQDLRERIIHALEADEATQRKVAERFCVSLSFVEKLWHRWRDSGSCAAKPPAGGKQRALKDHTALLRSAVAHQPDATLEALRNRMAAQGPQARPATIGRALHWLLLPVKKSLSTQRSAIRNASRRCASHSARRSRSSRSDACNLSMSWGPRGR